MMKSEGPSHEGQERGISNTEHSTRVKNEPTIVFPKRINLPGEEFKALNPEQQKAWRDWRDAREARKSERENQTPNGLGRRRNW